MLFLSESKTKWNEKKQVNNLIQAHLEKNKNFHGSFTEKMILSNFSTFVCFTLEIRVWSTVFFPEDSGHTED